MEPVEHLEEAPSDAHLQPHRLGSAWLMLHRFETAQSHQTAPIRVNTIASNRTDSGQHG